MFSAGVDERQDQGFPPRFVPALEPVSAPQEDGPCVRGGAFVGGELFDESALDARESELTTLSAHLDVATHRQLRLIRIMDVSERWSRQGAKSCAAWLSWKIGLAPGPAREHVRVANALAALPRIDDALRRGVISYSKVRAMTRVATPANEQKLLDAALETTAAQLERICRGLRQQQREDGRPPEDDAPERHVRLRHRGDGTVRVEAVLLPDEAERVMDALRLVRAAMNEGLHAESEAQPDLADALTRIADDLLAGTLSSGALSLGALSSGAQNADPRSRGNVAPALDDEPAAQLTADARSRGNAASHVDDPPGIGAAGCDDATRGIPGDPILGAPRDSTSTRSRGNAAARTSGPDRAQLIVHLTEDRIDGGHAAYLDDGSRISPETFRRLACDCALLGVHEDRSGDPLDVGRKIRSIPPALRRAVMLRDEHCQFPGCTHHRHIDLHHIEHWIHGGPTSKTNLIALCTFHHRLVHEGGFTLERRADGPRFVAPDHEPLPTFHIPPSAPADPLEAFERAHENLSIHDETGLTRWDGEPIHYGDIVEVLCATDDPSDFDLPVKAWLRKHNFDA